VLDNACGTGAFLVAAKEGGRRYLGMERSPEYAEVARERLKAA
jgi:DNA modification methylase